MIYQNFSKRQLLTLTWWNKPQFMDCDGIICDGSIRSGKTVSMTDGFILWSMSRFNGQSFAICGKTIESLRRNVITLMPQWLEGIFSITERRSENKLIITSGGVTNSYYMFGGKDESSYTLVQGITLAGVLFDEVASCLALSWSRLWLVAAWPVLSSGSTATPKTPVTGSMWNGSRKRESGTSCIFISRWTTI